jgi:quercetin dioxygenase-like cupin family protein
MVMQFGVLPFMTIDWNTVSATEHPGALGVAVWRTVEAGAVRVRMVEYSPGYVADHWCNRGHVLLVLDGELTTELQDGRVVTLTRGMSYQVANDAAPHRSRTEHGARLFVVD